MIMNSPHEDNPVTPLYVFLVMLLVVFLNYVVNSFSALHWFTPWVLSSAAFYWFLFRPNYLPNSTIFFLGLLVDGLTGVPFGVHVLGLLALRHLSIYQRQYLEHNPFLVIWTAYAMNMCVVYLVMSFFMWLTGVPLTRWVLLSWFSTSLLFPFMYLFMAIIHYTLRKE